MSFWAIDYDLDEDGMREAGCSAEDVARLRGAIEGCFAEHCFVRLDGAGFHVSEQKDSLANVYSACLALTEIADSEKFISRLNLFRVNDLTDFLPFLQAAKSSPLGQEDNEDSGDQSSVGFTLTAAIQDLFIDGPEHGPKRPHVPARKRSAKTS